MDKWGRSCDRRFSTRCRFYTLQKNADRSSDPITGNAWRALFAAQLGWMLDAMDFLLFTFAIVPIQKEFALSSATMGGLTSVALIAGAGGGIAFGRIADAIG